MMKFYGLSNWYDGNGSLEADEIVSSDVKSIERRILTKNPNIKSRYAIHERSETNGEKLKVVHHI